MSGIEGNVTENFWIEGVREKRYNFKKIENSYIPKVIHHC